MHLAIAGPASGLYPPMVGQCNRFVVLVLVRVCEIELRIIPEPKKLK
jgi:hypothetical protein